MSVSPFGAAGLSSLLNHKRGNKGDNVLSNEGIRLAYAFRHIDIEPFNDSQLQPASYDVRLGSEFIYLNQLGIIDPFKEQGWKHTLRVPKGDAFYLSGGDYVLGVTAECVSLSPEYGCELVGKSSLGRLGISVHITAGWIDPGFKGFITLEIVNFNRAPVALWPGMPIGTLRFTKLDSPSTAPYRGKYADAATTTGPQISRYYLNERSLVDQPQPVREH